MSWNNIIPAEAMIEDNSLTARLRRRAEIRRSIPRGEPDRIADLLEEAADEIDHLQCEIWDYSTK